VPQPVDALGVGESGVDGVHGNIMKQPWRAGKGGGGPRRAAIAMAGLVAAIHVLLGILAKQKTRMPDMKRA
jgi:hypothetical protein